MYKKLCQDKTFFTEFTSFESQKKYEPCVLDDSSYLRHICKQDMSGKKTVELI